MFTASVLRRSPARLDGMIRNLRGPKQVKVGLPSGKAPGDVIKIGVWNHFGTARGIPPRPFMANAMRNNQGKYRRMMMQSARQLLMGNTALPVVLNRLGALAQGDIQQEITALRTPPNSPSTIAQKGSSNPLIDSGRMRASVTWEVDR
jgi:hypothetical protein